ncbi:MAG TPA: hypothetical protein VIQ31_35775, partial [Phormidium sp.]
EIKAPDYERIVYYSSDLSSIAATQPPNSIPIFNDVPAESVQPQVSGVEPVLAVAMPEFEFLLNQEI